MHNSGELQRKEEPTQVKKAERRFHARVKSEVDFEGWVDGKVTTTFAKAQKHKEACCVHHVGFEAAFLGVIW